MDREYFMQLNKRFRAILKSSLLNSLFAFEWSRLTRFSVIFNRRQSHDYTYIGDDHDVTQRPLPPPPKVDKRERPPASLPTGPTTRTPLRPHSISDPKPFLGKDQEHSSSPVFPKQKGQILNRPAASLPRRTSSQELLTPSRIPDRKKMSRSSSEACITSKQSQGNDFDNVIKQLQLPTLSLIHEGGNHYVVSLAVDLNLKCCCLCHPASPTLFQ